jgi:hypothetical protein
MDILYPVFLLFLHTMMVAFRLGYLRFHYVNKGQADPRYYIAYQGEEPEKLRIHARHLINLLETPLLFYIGCIIALVTQQAGSLVVGLAWAYVAARLVHSVIHLGSNKVIRRFQVFALSLLLLLVMLGTLFFGLLTR